MLHKLEKSSDPEDALKLKRAVEQAAQIKSAEMSTNDSKATHISSKNIQSVPPSSSISPIISTSQESHNLETLKVWEA